MSSCFAMEGCGCVMLAAKRWPPPCFGGAIWRHVGGEQAKNCQGRPGTWVMLSFSQCSVWTQIFHNETKLSVFSFSKYSELYLQHFYNTIACVLSMHLCFLYYSIFCSVFNLPPSQSRCVHCGASWPRISSPGSCPCSGRTWRSTWHAATPTQCPCAIATPQREAAGATTPPCANAWQWSTTPRASRCVICHPTTASMSVCHWPTQRGRKRAERSPSRLRRTVSLGRKLQNREAETCHCKNSCFRWISTRIWIYQWQFISWSGTPSWTSPFVSQETDLNVQLIN